MVCGVMVKNKHFLILSGNKYNLTNSVTKLEKEEKLIQCFIIQEWLAGNYCIAFFFFTVFIFNKCFDSRIGSHFSV